MNSKQIINMGIQAGYNVELARQFGIVTAIVLNRLVFLHKQTPREDGFTWQTAKDWEEHTGLSDYQVKQALHKLADAGIIELKNTYIVNTLTKCRHQRFILKSDSEVSLALDSKETYESGNEVSSKSIILNKEHSIEHSIEHTKVQKKSLECARKLRDGILAIYPNNVGARKKDCIERWAVDIDKMHRLDDRSWENIEQAIEWALRDKFWQRNVWSGANLRKHYDRIEADARAKFMKHGTIVVGANPTDIF